MVALLTVVEPLLIELALDDEGFTTFCGTLVGTLDVGVVFMLVSNSTNVLALSNE
jgi:hypothetical protein